MELCPDKEKPLPQQKTTVSFKAGEEGFEPP